MNATESLLARRYARAFLLSFTDISSGDIDRIAEVDGFLRGNKQILFFLSLSHIARAVKNEFLKNLFEKYSVSTRYMGIVYLLLNHHRGQLLAAVFRHIVLQYKKDKKISCCVISTAHALEPAVIKSIVQCVSDKTGMTVLHTHTIDPSLIAGIRLRSDTYLWEYSVGKQLRILGQKQFL